MSIIRKFLCDVCGSTAEGPGHCPVGWTSVCWRPGLVTNTKKRPDRHLCSAECVAKERSRESPE